MVSTRTVPETPLPRHPRPARRPPSGAPRPTRSKIAAPVHHDDFVCFLTARGVQKEDRRRAGFPPGHDEPRSVARERRRDDVWQTDRVVLHATHREQDRLADDERACGRLAGDQLDVEARGTEMAAEARSPSLPAESSYTSAVTPCSAAEFLEAPEGRYVTAASWFYFATSAIVGCVAWGRPGPEDAEAVIRLGSVWLDPRVPARGSFFDVRSVEVAQAAAVFPVFREHMEQRRGELARAVTRFAIVHPQGIVGVVASGFFGMVPPPYPLRLFTDVDEALAWLGEAEPSRLANELTSIRAAIDGTSPSLRELQRVLDAGLRHTTLARAARSLGLSARTLQRRLRADGTTFERELNRARVRAAQALMSETDASLTAIAFEVGCASPAHLSVLFRKVTGESPSEWRRAHRRGE